MVKKQLVTSCLPARQVEGFFFSLTSLKTPAFAGRQAHITCASAKASSDTGMAILEVFALLEIKIAASKNYNLFLYHS